MPLSPPRHLTRADYRRVRWKNDGGWTTEIARRDSADDEGFDWRVSIADIERDGPFSTFPGIDRELVLLEGAGIELDFGDDRIERLDRRFARLRFSGEDAVECRLLAGVTRDFNVMTRRGRICAEVTARPLVGPMLIFAEPDAEWLVHVHAGHADARIGDTVIRLAKDDTLVFRFDHAHGDRMVLDGGGEIVLVKFA